MSSISYEGVVTLTLKDGKKIKYRKYTREHGNQCPYFCKQYNSDNLYTAACTAGARAYKHKHDYNGF